MSNRFELQHIFKAPVNQVYRAFSTPDALTQWLSPFGFFTKAKQIGFKAEGNYKASFINSPNDTSHSLSGKYFDIQPLKLILYKDGLDDPNLPDEILVTVQFRRIDGGTEVRIVQENVSTIVPTEMCYRGWQGSFVQLAQFIEPEISASE